MIFIFPIQKPISTNVSNSRQLYIYIYIYIYKIYIDTFNIELILNIAIFITYCIKSSITSSSSRKPSVSYTREAGVRPYFCSIIFNACSWSSKFFCIIILLNISYSFAAHICSNRFYKTRDGISIF